MPFAVKDLVETAGIRSTRGSPLFAEHVPAADDLLAARLRAAGAILIGKTNVPEFGLGSHSYNPVHGVTRNPYDLRRSAGGSSGGAAAALAARLVAVADGSDLMGSLRNPAAFCNVYGFRPSFGRVPSVPEGDAYLSRFATDGPMARTPRDLALLLDTLAGPGSSRATPIACRRILPSPKGWRRRSPGAGSGGSATRAGTIRWRAASWRSARRGSGFWASSVAWSSRWRRPSMRTGSGRPGWC